jgi:hypothetical protein
MEKTPYGMCPANRWKDANQGEPPVIYPELVRQGWGMKFQKMFDHFPCPPGFNNIGDGFCAPYVPENESIFYTDKAYTVRDQYWKGYTQAPMCSNNDRIHRHSPFDQNSVNPFTGEFQTYFPAVTNKCTDYRRNASKDSLLA